MSTKRKKIYFGIFWVLLVVSFLFFATLLVLVANGYHLDFKKMRLEKKGMLVLSGDKDRVSVKIGQNEPRQLNFELKQMLLPGRYEVKVSRDGYHDWSHFYVIKGGMAAVNPNVYLFINNPKPSKLVINEAKIRQLETDFKDQRDELVIKDRELYRQDKLVTRFSQSVLAAAWDADTNHIFVQIGSEIHVLDADGSNDINLFSLKQKEPTVFALYGKKMQYIFQNELYEIKIR